MHLAPGKRTVSTVYTKLRLASTSISRWALSTYVGYRFQFFSLCHPHSSDQTTLIELTRTQSALLLLSILL